MSASRDVRPVKGLESYCIPNFDSPSVFARILDKNKGGHFSITPTVPFTTKQNYLPSSNVLQTKFLSDKGVVCVTDFLPRQANGEAKRPLLFWLTRRVEIIRGTLPLRVECAPAFNYARDKHTTEIVADDTVQCHVQNKAVFRSPNLDVDLRYVAESTVDNVPAPEVDLGLLDLSSKGHLGPAAYCNLSLEEGQRVTFVFRICPKEGFRAQFKPTQGHADELGVPFEKVIRGVAKMCPDDDPVLTKELLDHLFVSTNNYWNSWIRRSTYQGSWKEAVHRSALALKLLIYEPTGAVVASPTFSLPEYIGGTRNWDYRASWIRDSSFTLYALIRLGFTHEANAYMDFIFERLRNKNPDGSLQIMYTIHGGKDLEEIELNHLDGRKGSKPVRQASSSSYQNNIDLVYDRIGNGASDHIQLDIYGELMDCIYLGQKVCSGDSLCSLLVGCSPSLVVPWFVTLHYNGMNGLTKGEIVVRHMCGNCVDFVVIKYKEPDLSIWSVRFREKCVSSEYLYEYCREVRGKKRHFTYSKIMLWVAIDRGLRLTDKRSLPCPNRNEWLTARDDLYEETDVLDSSVLIMPLVFFMTPSDPRFVNTLKQILKTPERGGLTSNNLVYRYDVTKSDDGVGGEEGTFCLCTLWCIEALTRAGEFDRSLLQRAITMFEDFLQYSNHVGLCTEEISESGEGIHVSMIYVSLAHKPFKLTGMLDMSP
ncbi:glycoside hydrolase family 15 protein [Boletus coccyginus]|nr:glycoside hydrolase family 15 protein [Boletus coccyginus]